MKVKLLCRLLLSLPKSIYLNFKLLPLKQAKYLPILFTYNLKTKGLKKDKILINAKTIKPFMIKINFHSGSIGVNIGNSSKGYLDINDNGKVEFFGKANLSQGISLRVNYGTLKIGSNFQCNKDCFISCDSNISIGNDVLLGWNVEIRDSDGHEIVDLLTGNPQKSIKPVIIGDHVWIGANASVLKGVSIGPENIIGYRSVVTKSFLDKNCIISGYPAKIIKNEIRWNN